MLCGAEHWTEMEAFGYAKRRWLGTFLGPPNGVPSHDTFGDVFAAVDPDAFEAVFRAWTAAVAGEIAGVLAADGKTIRRSFDAATARTAVHMVRAWAADNGVVFGQLAVEDKSCELAAIPALLRPFNMRDLIVTIDAPGCQKGIAAQIVSRGGDSLLRVKGNQPTLHADIAGLFEWAEKRLYSGLKHAHSGRTDKGHGRVETRRVTVLWDLRQISGAEQWPQLRCVVRVRSERTVVSASRTRGRPAEKPGGPSCETSVEDRFYISSVGTRRSEELGRAARAHPPGGRREQPALEPRHDVRRRLEPRARTPRGPEPLAREATDTQHPAAGAADTGQEPQVQTLRGGPRPRLPPQSPPPRGRLAEPEPNDFALALALCLAGNQPDVNEIGAEVFAAEFLFPEADFVELMGPMSVSAGACTANTLVEVKQTTHTTLSYAGLVKRAERLGFLLPGATAGVKWRSLEESIYGVPAYKRFRRGRGG